MAGAIRVLPPSDSALSSDSSRLGTDWIEELWELEVRRALGRSTEDPDWFAQPALGRLTAAKPATLEAFAALNEGRSYAEQVKPYNFMLVAQTAPFGHPSGVEPQRPCRHMYLAPDETASRVAGLRARVVLPRHCSPSHPSRQ